MIKTTTCLLSALIVLSGLGSAAEEVLPFTMPIPEGWRTETLPFPLEFAPDLPYTGLEELRFAPGFFEEGGANFWSYAFIWWVGTGEPNDLTSIATHLEDYFRGLADAVAKEREAEVGDATFAATLAAGPGSSFNGQAETFDPFVTNSQVRLNIRGNIVECPDQDRQAILFALSPQASDHPVWNELDAIRSGFRCDSTGE